MSRVTGMPVQREMTMKHLGEIEKLEKYLGGVKEMKKLPSAMVPLLRTLSMPAVPIAAPINAMMIVNKNPVIIFLEIFRFSNHFFIF